MLALWNFHLMEPPSGDSTGRAYLTGAANYKKGNIFTQYTEKVFTLLCKVLPIFHIYPRLIHLNPNFSLICYNIQLIIYERKY